MEVELLLFGIVKEMAGQSKIKLHLEKKAATVQDIKTALQDRFPESKKLKSLLIAVNENYADANQTIQSGDEIAIIPPVSGG